MKSSNISNTVDLLSSDRLKSYKLYFNLKNNEECIGVYLWNDALSTAFFKLLRALLHKDLKCKAPLIEPNLRRNLGKWST
ncbi:hypothetical protein ECD73_18440 [Acinetobacter baumannii]|nr:hypothetical protein [Acinetobacter baumannii]